MIKVKERVIHDGKTYETGEKIEQIKEKQAKRLVDLGVAFFVDSNIEQNNELDDIAKELDDAFNADGLKEAAKKCEIEFPGNISKSKLIELIIEEEKEEEVLNMVEDGE